MKKNRPHDFLSTSGSGNYEVPGSANVTLWENIQKLDMIFYISKLYMRNISKEIALCNFFRKISKFISKYFEFCIFRNISKKISKYFANIFEKFRNIAKILSNFQKHKITLNNFK